MDDNLTQEVFWQKQDNKYTLHVFVELKVIVGVGNSPFVGPVNIICDRHRTDWADVHTKNKKELKNWALKRFNERRTELIQTKSNSLVCFYSEAWHDTTVAFNKAGLKETILSGLADAQRTEEEEQAYKEMDAPFNPTKVSRKHLSIY